MIPSSASTPIACHGFHAIALLTLAPPVARSTSKRSRAAEVPRHELRVCGFLANLPQALGLRVRINERIHVHARIRRRNEHTNRTVKTN